MKEYPYLLSFIQRKPSWLLLGFVVIISVVLNNESLLFEKIKDHAVVDFISDDNAFYPKQRIIQQTFQLRNPSPRIIDNAVFYVYSTVKKTTNQQVDEIEILQDYRLINDADGNQLIEFSLPKFDGGEIHNVAIKTRLKIIEKLQQAETETASSDIHERFTDRVNQNFLRANQKINSDILEIQQLAAQLKADDLDQTILNIMVWINDNIELTISHQKTASIVPEFFVPSPPPALIDNNTGQLKGVQKTLKRGKGNVLERIYLFTALCRANKIPARPVIGYVYNPVMKTSAWLEFYDQSTWLVADLERLNLSINQSHYAAMRIIRNPPAIPFNNLDELLYEAVGLEVTLGK